MTNQINFTDLQTAISKIFNNIDVQIAVNEHGRPTIQHADIMDQVGCFGNVIAKASIDFFNYSRPSGDNNNFWGTVYLNYESFGGGSNGMQILSCWYNDGQWKIEPTKK
jgi:hypothetical protein